MLEAIAERVPLEQGGDGKSGSRVERVRLAESSRRATAGPWSCATSPFNLVFEARR